MDDKVIYADRSGVVVKVYEDWVEVKWPEDDGYPSIGDTNTSFVPVSNTTMIRWSENG